MGQPDLGSARVDFSLRWRRASCPDPAGSSVAVGSSAGDPTGTLTIENLKFSLRCANPFALLDSFTAGSGFGRWLEIHSPHCRVLAADQQSPAGTSQWRLRHAPIICHPNNDGDRFAAEPAATTDRADPDPVGDVSPEHDHADGHRASRARKR